MKTLLSTLVTVTWMLVASSSVSAQNPQFGAGGRLDVDGLAQRTFTTSDRNHDGELDRGEFATAQRVVHSAVSRLSQSGMIGRGQPLNLGGLPNGGRALAGGWLNNNDHITRPEFTLYVRNAVEQADAAMRRNLTNRSYPSNYRRGYGRRGSYGRGYSNSGRPRSLVAVAPVNPLVAKKPNQPAPVGPLATKGQTATNTQQIAGQTATIQKPKATAKQHHATHKSTAPSGKSKSSGQHHAPHPPANHHASVSHGHAASGHHKR